MVRLADLTEEELAGATLFNQGAASGSVSRADLSPEEQAGATFFDQAPEIGGFESFVRGGAQGGTLGFSDEIAGLIPALDLFRPGDSTFGSRFREGQQESEAANLAAQEANPKTFRAGQATGILAPLLATGGAAGVATGGARAGAGALSRIAGSAVGGGAIGGLTAAGTSEKTIGEEGFAGDVARGAGFGAVTGGVLRGAGAGTAALARKAGPQIGQAAGLVTGVTSGLAAGPAEAVIAGKFGAAGGKKIGEAIQRRLTATPPSGGLKRVGEGLFEGVRSGRTGKISDIITGGAAGAAAKLATPAEKFVASETSEKFRVQSLKKADKDFEKEQRRQERRR